MARRAGLLPAGRYFSRVAHRTFDVPINRVLAWLIHDLDAGLRTIKKEVGSPRLTPGMERMDAQIQEALRHHWLADVEPSADILADLMLSRIDAGRGAYRHVLALARRRQRLADRDFDRRWQEIVSLLAVGWSKQPPRRPVCRRIRVDLTSLSSPRARRRRIAPSSLR